MNLTYFSAGQYTDVWSYVGRRDDRRMFDRRFEVLSRTLPDVPPMEPADLGRGDRVWFYPGYTGATGPCGRCSARCRRPATRIRVAMYAWLDDRGIGLANCSPPRTPPAPTSRWSSGAA